jgi:uncharacterized protein (TIGR03067 family)
MRKSMAGLAVFVLMAGTAVWGGDAKKDHEKLQGTWTLTEIEFGGMKKPVPEGKSMQMVVKGDMLTTKGGPKGDQEATFKLDASKKPRRITMTKKDGGADDVRNGIYELKGDTLRIGFSGKGPKGESPAGFDAEGIFIMTLKKAK